jgi:Ca2+/H+ antiporter
LLSSSSSTKYHKLNRESENEFTDKQFEQPPSKIPYKAIGLAVVLFVVGSVLIILSALLLAGHIDTKYSDRTWPLLILGLLMFIPGSYHVHLAYYAWKGTSGYSFDDIPEYE